MSNRILKRHGRRILQGGVVAVLASAGACGDSPAKPTPEATFDSLVVTLSSKITVGRTVRPVFATSSVGEQWGRTFEESPDLASKVSLKSSNPGVLTVQPDGSIRAVGAGESEITATFAGHTTRTPVEVFAGYTVTPLSESDDYLVSAVNDAGDIVGTRLHGTSFLRRGDVFTDLGDCVPSDINNAGNATCTMRIDCGELCYRTRAAVYEDGALRPLAESFLSASATGISENGIVIGYGQDSTDHWRVFLRTPSGVRYVNTTYIWTSYHVNNSGHGVAVHPSLYDWSGLLGDSELVGLLPARGRWSQARDVNDSDDVVGTSERMSSQGVDIGGNATVWRAANSWHPESPGYRANSAVGITESGQVVGLGRDGIYVWQAGRYTILADALADDAWTLTQVVGVSHSRIIAAKGQSASGVTSVVLIDLGSAP